MGKGPAASAKISQTTVKVPQDLAVVGGDSILAAGRRVLETEAAALLSMAKALDASFARAVTLLAGVSGRVIVTGMGKSGHVARKIAATFASTGTPAHFVHPAEASHGDLGMIAEGDGVIALSNSGETTELGDVVAHTRRFGIGLIAMTAKENSSLAEAADVALILLGGPEACPMGLAPTTSTTAMLALGDALAVSLLDRKGFTAERFRDLHPGGKLGRRLLKVADIMHGMDITPVVAAKTTMADAILTMTTAGFGTVGVVDNQGKLEGIVTDGDLRRHLSAELLSRPIAAIMTRNPKVIAADDLAASALLIMNENKITVLFVVDADGRPLGLVRMHDCLRAGVA
ncbi:MAG: KpsF/GutQ family sugar-phosphate isomerase [Alphaproteobacteria bacterium]